MTRITKHLACAEVTVDMAVAMNLIAKKCFPKTEIVTDRFHVQKLASEAVQEVRIRLRWEIIDVENEAISTLKNTTTIYKTEILENGETKRQLLARSRFTLFKSQKKWTENQKERAVILFNLYPEIKKAYESIRFILSQALKSVFESKIGKDVARTKLALWYNKVEDENLKSFNTIKKTIQHHYKPILNYFNNRNTNASAESFNAKIKAFRAQFRGVRDVTFFLYRLTKIYA
ncbi:transposase [Tenacibaculum finnmarkense]|uniref:ISAon1 family transposase n=1 Tax=Tenacibaculum finnmarkense TaxID=2781243 RepID=UPI001EFAF64F|nr:transposase [Tenacibaculum finnmarkense]